MDIIKPLSEKDIKQLDDFLLSDATSDECMMLDEIHGYLTAVVCSPGMIMPSEWMPAMWGEPEFKSDKQAETIFSLLMRMYNEINSTLLDGNPVDPILWEIGRNKKEAAIDAEGWCSGFMQGVSLRNEIWRKHLEGELKDIMFPIFILCSKEVAPELTTLLDDNEKKDFLISAIPVVVLGIYNFWRSRQKEPIMPHRKEKKVGRNNPCPCGSGKKYKKCCMGKERILH